MIFRLAGVLRARVAQETVAKAEVARSRFAANAALAEVHRVAATLDRAQEIHVSNASALAGALMGRQAMAASLSAARVVADDADGVVADKVADLASAARQRMAMEKLAERHAAARRATLEAAERAELDDLVNSRHARRAAEPVESAEPVEASA